MTEWKRNAAKGQELSYDLADVDVLAAIGGTLNRKGVSVARVSFSEGVLEIAYDVAGLIGMRPCFRICLDPDRTVVSERVLKLVEGIASGTIWMSGEPNPS